MARVLFLQNIEYDFPGVMYISAFVKSRGHDCDLLIETKPHKIGYDGSANGLVLNGRHRASFDLFFLLALVN